MATLKFIQAQRFSLAGSGSSIGDTTITLQSMTGIDGDLLTTTNVGTIGFGTLEPGSGEQEEAISYTGITQNSNGTATLTGVKSVLFVSPYTGTSGLAKTHAGASTFILSNDAAFYGAILDYVDSALISGGIPATNLVQGISKLSVAAVSAANPIVVGDNDPRVPSALQATFLSGITNAPNSPGYIISTASTGAPLNGFIKADGSLQTRTGTGAPLFSVIGSTYSSGDGSTTFGLPISKRIYNNVVQFDSASTSNSASASSFTQSHTIAGYNSLLVVGIEASGGNIVTPTYNSVSMTALTTISGTSFMWFYLANPTQGTNNIAGSFSSGQYNCVAVSYNNIRQSSPLDAQAITGIASVASITLTSTKVSPPDLTLVFAEQQAANGTAVMTNGVVRVNSTAQSRSMMIGELLADGKVSSVITFGGTANAGGAIASFFPANSPVSTYDLIKI